MSIRPNRRKPTRPTTDGPARTSAAESGRCRRRRCRRRRGPRPTFFWDFPRRDLRRRGRRQRRRRTFSRPKQGGPATRRGCRGRSPRLCLHLHLRLASPPASGIGTCARASSTRRRPARWAPAAASAVVAVAVVAAVECAAVARASPGGHRARPSPGCSDSSVPPSVLAWVAPFPPSYLQRDGPGCSPG